MLTVNAGGHALMRRFHKPEDEKRMVVTLDDAEYDIWLDAPAERMASFVRCYRAELLTAEAGPLRRWNARISAARRRAA
jgi:putative SOS response-associated peptidase YedK